jgi:ribosomal subunit interface protein
MKLASVDRSITIQSSNVHLGDRLPDHARESILRVAGKYFGRLNAAAVHFTKEGITYRCSVNMQMGALPMKSAEASDKSIYLAFDTALDKLAKQLRRSKRELREDKAKRADKDVVLREGMRPIGGLEEAPGSPGPQPAAEADLDRIPDEDYDRAILRTSGKRT